MKNDYYSGTYIPGIVKWGKITLLLGIFAGFLPALVMAFRGYMPPVSAIIAGTLMQISVSGAFYIVEPISYFPILGIPGKCGIAFISSFTGSDVAAVMTRELYEDGDITDDERTIFVAYQYAGSACINNTITGGAPLVAICPVALGPCIVIMVVCKLIGANIVRLILHMKSKKAKA